MDIAVWATVLFASVLFAAIGVWFYGLNSKWFAFTFFILAGCALMITGIAGVYEGIEYVNGTMKSENWTYAPQTCVSNSSYYNGTDTFTDNTTATCYYANASLVQEELIRTKAPTLIANGLSMVFIFIGVAFGYFGALLGLKKG